MSEENKKNKYVVKDNSDAVRDPERQQDFEVHVDANNIERAIKNLKRKLIREGFYRDIKQRRFFEKPTEKRKRKKQEAEKRMRKDQSKGSPFI